MERVVYNLSGSSFPIKTDDLELTNFLFSFLNNSFLKFKENSFNLSEKDLLFLSALDSLKTIFIYLNEQKKNSNFESTILKEQKNCCCSEDLKKIEYYIKTIINSLDKEVL